MQRVSHVDIEVIIAGKSDEEIVKEVNERLLYLIEERGYEPASAGNASCKNLPRWELKEHDVAIPFDVIHIGRNRHLAVKDESGGEIQAETVVYRFYFER